MSAYLQRMAALASTSRGRVHPVVEPRFGAANLKAELNAQPFSELASESAERIEGMRPSAPSVHRDESVSERRERQEGEGRQGQDGFRPKRYRPLLAEASGDSGARTHEAEAFGRKSGGGSLHEVTGDFEEQRAHTRASGGEDGGATRTFEPLIKEANAAETFGRNATETGRYPTEAHGSPRVVADSRRGQDEMFGTRALRSSVEEAAARRMSQHQQNRVQPQQQRDEIQIHIGRIEVTAMPPAAPRPMPATVRKTQTLDEYLRRTNGRAG